MLEQQATQLRQQIEALLRDYPDLATDEFLRADMIEGSTEMGEVLTAIHHMVEDAKMLRDGAQPRVDELIARRTRMQRRIDFGRELIRKIMETAALRRIELPEVTFSLRNNPRQISGDLDAARLPDELVKVVRQPDRTKIREWLEAGRDVPGVHLDNAPPSLLAKVK